MRNMKIILRCLNLASYVKNKPTFIDFEQNYGSFLDNETSIE